MLVRPFVVRIVRLSCVVSTMLIATASGDQLRADDWPQFRGKDAAGTAALSTTQAATLPTEWDLTSGENVRWTAPIPGLGLGSAIVCGERVFLVTAVGEKDPDLKTGLYGNIVSVQDESEHQWLLYCLAKRSGETMWKRMLHEGVPAIKRHTKASHANTTPATNGRYVVVLLGSEGLHCYDMNGNQVWKKDFGVLDSGYYVLPGAQWGFGSSPIIFEDLVLIQCDVQEGSFIAAFDLETGEQRWRTDRDDVPSWGTPAVHKGNRTQMIVNGYRHSGGYDALTGEELWRIAGGGDIPVPTPIIAKDLIVLSSAHGKVAPLRAVHVDAEGEIEPDNEGAHKHLAWNKAREGVYMPTPLAYRDLLYTCRINGVLTCYDLVSGERVYRERLGGNAFTASPVVADDKLYFASEDGDIYVVRAGMEFKLLATNSMEDVCMATPSIADGILFIRTKDSLHALAKPAVDPVELAGTAASPANGDVGYELSPAFDNAEVGMTSDVWHQPSAAFGQSDHVGSCGPSEAATPMYSTVPSTDGEPYWLEVENVLTDAVAVSNDSLIQKSIVHGSYPPVVEQEPNTCSCSIYGQQKNCGCGHRRRRIRDCVRRLFCR